MTTVTGQTTQVYQVFIKAPPEAIWEAITKPEFTAKYFYGARISVAPQRYRSLGPNGEMWGDAEVAEWDPPRRLVHGWRSLYDPDMAAEEESRVTWEIEPQDLEWLKDPRSHFPPQTDGDLVKDGVCVLFIAQKLGVAQPTATTHLQALARAGLVTSKRIGQWTFYKRDEAAIRALKRQIRDEL
jgi:uncharacterized protein YndB with AHSA1/START domain